ncbi:MAG: hypothetical protein IKC13_00160 [Elusimicrobiaceae bacterium]|nr:hypothetical protein [Elusimicrobiaceae bacterium]
MMPIHHVQPNFSGGEVSPHLYSRADAADYHSWLKSACNFFVHPQGGASNRPGTAYVNTAKYADKKARLVPFVLGDKEAYVVEMGHQYLRFHTQAGTLLQNDAIFELPTEYTEHEIDSVSYVQYGQSLYFAHQHHCPKQLLRTDDGYFVWRDFALKDGPFTAFNTDEHKKVRLVCKQQEVISEGVKAVLSFLPVSYNNYFIHAYWKGVRFYDPNGYGFNIAEVVAAFNRTFADTGCVAQNQGGVLRIESPQATGGDYNGAELLIEYYPSLMSAPALVVSQQMSGGSNEGEKIASGEEEWYLESDFDLFSPNHITGLFALQQQVESSQQSGTLAYEDISASIKSGGDWRLRTTGSWYGEIALESSEDNQTWTKVKHFTKAQDEENINTFGNLALSAKMRYLRVRCLAISGEMGYILQADGFLQEGIVKLEKYIDSRQVLVSLQRHAAVPEQWSWQWAQGSFCPGNGYPSCVFFYQDRLGFAGTQAEPQTIWFSKTSQYNDFGTQRTLQDNDAMGITLSGKKRNAIHSVAVGAKLFIFTSGNEWSLSADGALSPYNITLTQETERGASSLAPIVVGSRTLYVQARGSVLRDFFYQYSTASYISRDLTLRCKHLFFNKTIKEMAYQQEPDSLLWCILTDGALLCLTYLPEEEIFAWTRHQTAGRFISVCCVPGAGSDEPWFLVQRNGKYLVERLPPRLMSKDTQDQVFLDCSVSKKSHEPFTILEGAAHLQGQNFCVLADGSPLYNLQISDGKIILPKAVLCAHAGLAYRASIQTLPLALSSQDGVGFQPKHRVVQVTLKLQDSLGGAAGTEGGKTDKLLYAPGENYATPPALQTRDFTKVFSSSHSLFPSVVFQQDEPFPVTLLAVISKVG